MPPFVTFLSDFGIGRPVRRHLPRRDQQRLPGGAGDPPRARHQPQARLRGRAGAGRRGAVPAGRGAPGGGRSRRRVASGGRLVLRSARRPAFRRPRQRAAGAGRGGRAAGSSWRWRSPNRASSCSTTCPAPSTAATSSPRWPGIWPRASIPRELGPAIEPAELGALPAARARAGRQRRCRRDRPAHRPLRQRPAVGSGRTDLDELFAPGRSGRDRGRGDDRYLAVCADTFADVGRGELVLYEDSDSCLSMAINRGHRRRAARRPAGGGDPCAASDRSTSRPARRQSLDRAPAAFDAWPQSDLRGAVSPSRRSLLFVPVAWPAQARGRLSRRGEVAQLVEHATENRGVGSSILPLAIARGGHGLSSGGGASQRRCDGAVRVRPAQRNAQTPILVPVCHDSHIPGLSCSSSPSPHWSRTPSCACW